MICLLLAGIISCHVTSRYTKRIMERWGIMLLPFLDSVVCMYANPLWTLIGQVLEKVSKEWSPVLMVAPYCKGAL